MPLSEHEQRQLEAIERSLYADDPKFARQVRAHDPARGNHHKLIQGGALLAVGLVLLVCTLFNTLFGVAGFLVMLVGAVRLTSGFATKNEPAPKAQGGRPQGGRAPRSTRSGQAKTSWTERAEERMRRRYEGEDQ